MTAREWKPGDVAVIEDAGVAVFTEGRRWCTQDGAVLGPEGNLERRPVVVIDPTDDEQVERLDEVYQRALDAAPRYHSLTDIMRAALREFANPTPPEPADPKARVTDNRENIWRLLADGDWACMSGPDAGEYLAWGELAERDGRVLSEGVTEDGAS